MKKLMILFAILNFVQIFAQDFEPLPIPTIPDREKSKFILGWQWNSDARSMDLLNTNMSQHGRDYLLDDYTHNTENQLYFQDNGNPSYYNRTGKDKILAIPGLDDFPSFQLSSLECSPNAQRSPQHLPVNTNNSRNTWFFLTSYPSWQQEVRIWI